MRRRTELPELLAPAGDMRALVAAVCAGADAVYIGGKAFGARAYARNFDIEEIKAAVEYCHLFGVRLYVAVNTLVYDKEMSALSDYALELWRVGVDAVICADLGAISEMRRRVPGLELHASTQMSVHSTEGALAAASLGCKRVVPARELSLENIRSIVDNSPTEVEIFLHGALCVCHSGQCLMSSMVGGRSGNRGECAQPCRLPYNGGKYALSLKDLSLAEHITELIDSGVASLKIEGRMKSAEYVYSVVRVYRELLDSRKNANKEQMETLRRAFSRGGFTDGYFTERLGDMCGVRSEADKEQTRELEVEIKPLKARATATVSIKRGEPARMTITVGKRQATVTGEIPDEAISSPLRAEDVRERLSKTGATPIELPTESIELELDDGLNLAPSKINALRRAAIAAALSCERSLDGCGTPCNEKFAKHPAKRLVSAQIYSPAAYDELLDRWGSEAKIADVYFLPLHRIKECKNIPSGVFLPPVVTDSESSEICELLTYAAEIGVRYALVGNVGHIAMVKRAGLSAVGDLRLNITNSLAREEYIRLGVSEVVLSAELTLPMARDVGGGIVGFGRLPLMITERCFMKNNGGCDRCAAGKNSLTDRTGKRFPMLREYKHRNLIFNSTVTYMGDARDKLLAAGLQHFHFIFSIESASDIALALRSYKAARPLPFEVRRMGKRDSGK